MEGCHYDVETQGNPLALRSEIKFGFTLSEGELTKKGVVDLFTELAANFEGAPPCFGLQL